MNFSREPSSEERETIRLFEDKKIGHRLLNYATSKVSRGMHFPKGASTIYLYGPSGVGKTTLLQNIAEKSDDNDLLYMLVKAPETLVFSWFDFQRRLLLSLDARARYNISYEAMNIRRRGDGSLRIDGKNNSISDLRLAVIKAMKCVRATKYIFDEVPHIKKGKSAYRVADQMDALKSFIDEAGLELEKDGITPIFVLAGTYELLEMMSVNGQLGRRSIKVPFPQYSLQNEAHVGVLKDIITRFQDTMDLPIKPNLVSRLEYLCIWSCGCVGVLKQWLNRSYAHAIMEKAQTLTDKHLKDNAPNQADVQRLSTEIALGERKLKELEGDLSAIYVNLGVPTKYIARMNTFLDESVSDIDCDKDEYHDAQ